MYLGQVQAKDDREIFRLIYQAAQQQFPKQTAEFDRYIQEQATKYGLEYSKIKAEEATATVLRSPIFWGALGIGLSLLMRR